MTFKALLDSWAEEAPATKTREAYSIHLTIDDAARLKALAELYPGTPEEQIVADLLNAALSELEAAIPYEPGDKVIREDDFGDPVYEDVGLAPRFRELVIKHADKLGD